MYYIGRFFHGELYYLEKIKVSNPLHIKKKFVWHRNKHDSSNYTYEKLEKVQMMINVIRKHRSNIDLHIIKENKIISE